MTLFVTSKHPLDRLDKGTVGDMMRIDYGARRKGIRVAGVART